MAAIMWSRQLLPILMYWIVITASYDDCSLVCKDNFCYSVQCYPGVRMSHEQFSDREAVNKYLAQQGDKTRIVVINDNRVIPIVPRSVEETKEVRSVRQIWVIEESL